LLYVLMALGYSNVALVAALGHAAFRMVQVLRAANAIQDSHHLRTVLPQATLPRVVPDWLFRLAWRVRRIDSDFHVMHSLHHLTSMFRFQRWKLNKWQQWIVSAVVVAIAGAPFTPLSHALEELLMELLPNHPVLALAIMAGHFAVAVMLVRLLLVKVLHPRRFFQPKPVKQI